MTRPLAVALLALMLAGCASPETAPGTTTPPPVGTTPPSASTPAPPVELPTTARGVAYSPRAGGAATFFDDAKELGDVVLWGGPIEQLADERSAPAQIAAAAHAKGLQVVIQTSPLVESGAGPAMDDALARSVAAFAARSRPEYLALGVEVNRFAERDAARFDAFVAWYAAAYDAVKAAAPETKVFVTFQYEWMEGRRGGLFGGPENATPQWDLYGRFDKLDLAAFTTYPGLVERDPANLSSTYFARLAALSRTLAITETAHFADAPAPGWESSPDEQAGYARAFLSAMDPLDPAFVVWLHAYDQGVGPAPFHRMGLSSADGAERPARAVWAGD